MQVDDFKRAFDGVGNYSGAEIYDFASEVVRTHPDVTGFNLVTTKTGRPTVSFDLKEGASAFTPYHREDGRLVGKHGSNGVIFTDMEIKLPESETLGTSADMSVNTTYAVSIVKGTKRFTADPAAVEAIAKSGLFKTGRPGLVGGGGEEQDRHPAESFLNELAEEVGNLEGERIDTGQSNDELASIAREFAGDGWERKIHPIGKYIDYNQSGGLLLAHSHQLEIGGDAFLSILDRAETVATANNDFLNGRLSKQEWEPLVKETLSIDVQDVTQPFDREPIKALMEKSFPEVKSSELMKKIYLDDSATPTYAHEEDGLDKFRSAKAQQLQKSDRSSDIDGAGISPDNIRAYVQTHLSELRENGKLQVTESGKLETKLDEQDLAAIIESARGATPPTHVDAIASGVQLNGQNQQIARQ